MTIPSRCGRCGKPRTKRKDSPGNYAGARGLCPACTSRFYRAGCPPEGPPPPMPAQQYPALINARRRQETALRMAEYARLRSARYSPAQAALRLGVSARTARRYERARTAQAAAASAA